MTTDQLLELATERHRAGDLPEARRLYQQVLAGAPALRVREGAVALFRFGLLELQCGRPDAALTFIDQAIAAAPDDWRYLFGRGEALAGLGRWEEAAGAYRRVLQADPCCADAHCALGVALQALGDDGSAIAAYDAAVRFKPDFPDAFNNLGNCHQLCGDFPAAEAAYRQALVLRPNFAGAMSNLGAVLQKMGHAREAVGLLRAACGVEPDVAPHAVNLGAALCRLGKFREAADVLSGTLQREGNNAEAAYNLANAFHGLGQLREAADQYRRATALRPDYADAWNNLGNVYKELGEFQLAMPAYEAAVGAQPQCVVGLNNMSCLLRTLGRLEEAEAVLRRGLDLNARHPALYDNLASVLKDAGRLDEAIDCFRKALALDPTGAATHGNLAYALSFQSLEGQPILEECRRWNDRHAAALRPEIPSHPNDRSPHRRLRIGYVSPNFRDHCQSLFTIPVLSHHDHAAFEIFCYSSVERPDDYTRRIAAHADVWRNVRLLDDAALCELIRADGIDILVDLTMHMADGRPLVFARKPAPVQVAWLAYPGTTGIGAMDYRFTDPRLDPSGFENHYSERTIRLPDSFWCYDPLTDQPGVNALPALARGYLTFGCLNNPCKLTDRTLGLWGRVLRALPDARLVLMAPAGSHRRHVLHRLAAQDVASERVQFVPYRPRGQYLRTYHDIDLGLDTFPYNGHTTSLDSFWMGVPVVTRVGQTCVGRGGLSQLFQLDLLELAAETDEAFVSAAVALARDLPRLAALREALRARLEHSPLMDGKRFARNIEAAYRQTFRDYCAAGQTPQAGRQRDMDADAAVGLVEDSPVPVTPALEQCLNGVEYYQPLYGVSGLELPLRFCRDRALAIAASLDHMGKNFRLIDFGSSLGYFPFFFADRGAVAAGVDINPQNTAVALATQRLNGLAATFRTAPLDLDTVRAISPGQYDVALILSVLHHVTHKNGIDYVAQLLAELLARIPVLILELAHRNEPVSFAWRDSLPQDPLAILCACGNVQVRTLGRFPSHLSTGTRPMYMVTR